MTRPRILYVVTEDWFFLSHFLGMARAARDAGYEVAVAARMGEGAAAIAAEGFRVHAVQSERGGIDPLTIIRSVLRLDGVMRRERPDLVHVIALKPILLAGPLARLRRTPALVVAPTGLGYLWTSDGIAAVGGRLVVRSVVRALRGGRTAFLFENDEDPAALGLDVTRDPITLIGGAGVDPSAFPPQPLPQDHPLRIAVVARMLRDKGVVTAVEAVRRARDAGHDVVLDLFGDVDPANPASLTPSELATLSVGDGVRWHGRTQDVAMVWRNAHVAMLLSAREGLPRSLVEAAASARPMIATDVPGCRRIVRHGVDGLLVPAGDATAAATAIATLARDPALRRRMGDAARTRFEAEFTVDAVTRDVLSLYDRLLGARLNARREPS